ncbi:unnamed protein product [Symbiodinium pilosum]|uniref:Integrase catalytic domain-containing protein n=1 Tax=Symbiodinium pilosum TaxID=2952 RepID=A0A812JBC1_SYMPI|nr:unnamed protein product [Symbiodinium pilosum]
MEPFTSTVVADNLVFAPHQDRNCAGYRTTVSGLSKFYGGQLWTEAAGGTHWRYVQTAIPFLDNSITWTGTGWHGTEPVLGDGVIAVSYVSTVNATINQETHSDSTLDSGLLTIEEKRTLNHLSDQFNPKQEQQHQPQPTSHTSNDARHHPNILTSRHTAYAKHVEVGVGDPALSPVFGDSEKDSGLKVEGGVPSLPESSDATVPKPWDLSLLSEACPEDRAVKDLWQRCREGTYDKTSEPDLRARGDKYALVVCAHSADGFDLPFVRGVPNKEAKTVTDALCDVLTQLGSFAGGDKVTFRIHSDQGKKFVAKIDRERLKVFNHFRTFAVSYSHQSNGRVEQLIDTLKSSTGLFLLSGQRDIRFWDEVMSHAAKLKCMRALIIPIPKDLPIPGDYVLARKPADVLPDFEDRTEIGVFLGLSDAVSNGTEILVQRGGGQASWDAPSHDQILTLEQWQGADFPNPEEVVWKLQQLLDKTRTPDSTKEIFNLFGHGVLMTPEPAAAVAAKADITIQEDPQPGKEMPTEWMQGKRCWVCNRSVVECYAAKVKATPPEPNGYQLDTADAETEADEAARLMNEVATMKDEMNGMQDKQVLEQLNRKNLKEEDPKAKAVSEPPWYLLEQPGEHARTVMGYDAAPKHGASYGMGPFVQNPSLPQIELNVQGFPDGPEHKDNLKAAQTELGCLLWISTKTRPDILAAVSIAASHLHKCPSRILKVAQGCWRYLRATLNIGLRFRGSIGDSPLQVWSDASFSPDGSRSRSGGVITINGCALRRWSTKQTVTAWSVCEAETDAMALAVSEAAKVLPLRMDRLGS